MTGGKRITAKFNILKLHVKNVKEDGISVSVINKVSGNVFKNITHKNIAIQAGGKIKKNS